MTGRNLKNGRGDISILLWEGPLSFSWKSQFVEQRQTCWAFSSADFTNVTDTTTKDSCVCASPGETFLPMGQSQCAGLQKDLGWLPLVPGLFLESAGWISPIL